MWLGREQAINERRLHREKKLARKERRHAHRSQPKPVSKEVLERREEIAKVLLEAGWRRSDQGSWIHSTWMSKSKVVDHKSPDVYLLIPFTTSLRSAYRTHLKST